MSKEKTLIDKQVKEYINQYKNYEGYIQSENWVYSLDVSDTYETESIIIGNIVKDLKNFIKENKNFLHYKAVKKLFSFASGILDIHINRIEEYLKNNNWAEGYKEERTNIESRIKEIENEGIDELNKILLQDLRNSLAVLEDRKREEIRFQNKIFTQKISVRANTLEIDINPENDSNLSAHIFFGDKKVSLIMRPYIIGVDNYTKERDKSLDINWPDINVTTSSELYINMNPKDIPPYNPNRHYFEQSTDILQFWQEEIQKIRNGVNINGYQLSSFLYFLINFGTVFTGSDVEKKAIRPYFRDNEYYFDESIKLGWEGNHDAVFLYGTRRFAKSFLESQYTYHGNLIIPNCRTNIIGMNTKDLVELTEYIDGTHQNMPPALRPSVEISNDKEIVYGVKQSAQDTLQMSRVDIINLDSGRGGKAGQKPAGGTPDRILIDEAGKGNVLSPYLALRPALASGGGTGKNRAMVLMAGTAGESSISADAEKILRNPEAFGVLPMNFDLLERISDPDYITWQKGKVFSTFVPAQMSLYVKKIKTNLRDFLGSDNDELTKIPFYKTNWKEGKEFFEARRKKAEKDSLALSKESAYHPLDIDDVFLSADKNPYDELGIKNHKADLELKGLTGKRVVFEKLNNGEVYYELSNKKIIEEYPYEGGAHDAPAVLFEEIEKGHIPPFGMYVIGIDDIKHDVSDGNSVFSVTVFKRDIELSEWSNRIVCTYATRPEKKETAYRQAYLIMKYFNAIAFPENDDEGFKDYIESRFPIDAMTHLAEGVDFSKSLGFHYNKNRKIGFSTAGNNVRKLNNKVIAYTQTELPDDPTKDMYLMINDIMLLTEMERYKPKRNADRIRSFGLCLLYAEYLDKNHMYMSTKYRRQGEVKEKKEIQRIGTFSRGMRKRNNFK